MRGTDYEQSSVFQLHFGGTASAQRSSAAGDPRDGDTALKDLSKRFDGIYAALGRPSIAPERLLMEQLDYNFLFRWFVGLSIDDPVWDVTVFTKNRDRLLKGEVAEAFFAAVLAQARQRGLLSDEHFTVDGT